MRIPRKIMALIVMLVGISANAQFNKGDRMVGISIGSFFLNSGGADVSFPQTRGYSSKTSSWGLSIEPAMGWFISGKTAIGGTLIIKPTSQKTRYEDGGTTFQEDQNDNFNIGLGAFARHYFSGNKESLMPFGQFGFNAGINSASSEGFKYYDATPDYKVSYDGKSSGGFFANATVQVGASKMVGENAALDFYVGYNYSYNKNTYKTTTLTDIDINGTIDFRSENVPTTKFTNHGVIVAVGFQVFIRKK